MSTVAENKYSPNITPRGIRNNNPTNLILTKINWVGKIPNELNSDGKFEQFKEMKLGVRAGMMDILNDYAEGTNTIRKLITELAPPTENNTENYIKIIAKKTGLNPDKIINLTERNFLNLMNAIIEVEQGFTLDPSYIMNGYNLLPTNKKALIQIENSPYSNGSKLVIFGIVCTGVLLAYNYYSNERN